MTYASVWFFYPLIICNIFILFIAISIKITIFANYKEAEECENQVERWIYLLKNMETLNRLPWAAQSAVFKKLESIADVSAMTRPTFWVHFSTCPYDPLSRSKTAIFRPKNSGF